MKKIVMAVFFLLVTVASATAGGSVVFTVDDGDVSTLEIAEIFKNYGYTATVCPITSRIGTPGYLSVADLQSLSREGFEIANHTSNHKYFTGMTDSEVISSVESASDAIEAWGIPRPTALIPPGGDFGEGEGNVAGIRLQNLLALTSIKVCRQAYPQNMADTETIVNRVETFDPMNVKVFSFRKATVGSDPMMIPDLFYDLIFQVREEGAMVVFVIHRVGDDATDEYSIPTRMLERMTNYISRQSGVQVMNLTKGSKKMLAEKPQIEEVVTEEVLIDPVIEIDSEPGIATENETEIETESGIATESTTESGESDCEISVGDDSEVSDSNSQSESETEVGETISESEVVVEDVSGETATDSVNSSTEGGGGGGGGCFISSIM